MEKLLKFVTQVCIIVSIKGKEMRQIIRNFNKEDCLHFEWKDTEGCCGAGPQSTGACNIPDSNGLIGPKICYMKAKYCKYQKKEASNYVHP